MRSRTIARAAILSAFAVLTATAAFAGSGQGHTVGTSSVMILPPRGISDAQAWATNTVYSQGDVVKHDNRFFWCQAAGGGANTSADAPVVDSDGRSDAGTNTWQFLPRDARQFGAVVNDGAAAVYLNDAPASLNSGIRLNANGGAWNIPEFMLNSPVYAISSSASNSVVTFDR